MAPRRGGGGGGGGGGSSSCDWSEFPCTTQLHHIYGDHTQSQFSQTELYGQVALYAIWSVALLVLFFYALKMKGRFLQLAILSYLCAFIFLVVRFSLILAEADVPIGYRHESSVVVLLERLGQVFLFAAAFPSPEARRFTKLVFWPLLGILAALNVAYLILDFLISAFAIDAWKEDWHWRFSDRDFGLVNTPHAIYQLLMNGDSNLSPFFVEGRMYDVLDEHGWQTRRDTQIQIGVAADFLALALAVFLSVVAAVPGLMRKKTAESRTSGTIFLLVAAFGLFLSALFRAIIATHYVLWNWNSVSDPSLWLQWLEEFTTDDIGLVEYGPDTFLPGYRTVVDGFWIIHAVFGPLGIVLACLCMVLWWRGRLKTAVLPPYGL